MVEALTICECGLLLWLGWTLEVYRRPAFWLLILVMLSCAAAYRIPRTASEFQASASIQGAAMALALLEGICQAAGGKRALSVLYCAAFGALFVVALKGLDERFGWFITTYTFALTGMLGAAVGAVTITMDRHCAWLAALCIVKPTGTLLYWFLSNSQQWWAVNNAVMATMALLMLAWIVLIPVNARSTAIPTSLRS